MMMVGCGMLVSSFVRLGIVVDGRESVVAECREAPAELRGYLGQRFQMLLASRSFREALPGHLPGDAASQERLPELEAKLKDLAQLPSV